MSPLHPGSRLCTGEWTGVTCSRRDRCARYVEIKDADRTARIYPSLCPGRDNYWPHFVQVEAAK